MLPKQRLPFSVHHLYEASDGDELKVWPGYATENGLDMPSLVSLEGPSLLGPSPGTLGSTFFSWVHLSMCKQEQWGLLKNREMFMKPVNSGRALTLAVDESIDFGVIWT